MKFKVITEPGEQSGYVSHVPALPGCWSQGATKEEALANVREAAEGWLEAQQDNLACFLSRITENSTRDC